MGEKAKLWVPSKGRVQGFLVSACSSSLEVPWYITNDKLKPRGEFAWGAYQTQDTPRKGAPQPSITHPGAAQRGVYPGSSKHAKAYAAPNQILMGVCSSSIAGGGRVVTNRLKALGLLLLRVVGASDSSIYACIQPCVLCENVPTLRTSGLAFLFFAFCVETPPLLHFSVHLVLPPLMIMRARSNVALGKLKILGPPRSVVVAVPACFAVAYSLSITHIPHTQVRRNQAGRARARGASTTPPARFIKPAGVRVALRPHIIIKLY
jgi:hypothetical protein